ncbi:hypothetical protein chiPu_0014824 [Chiloscyllium punctatum]|uniref:Uncharacterized protein n=1 Tax=Chiloscyllium punctatum TaxID=137246 RepID=A0A401T121_CHIPU|nr:hypothetical protein [Chiloscyllium punctatum]
MIRPIAVGTGPRAAWTLGPVWPGDWARCGLDTVPSAVERLAPGVPREWAWRVLETGATPCWRLVRCSLETGPGVDWRLVVV